MKRLVLCAAALALLASVPVFAQNNDHRGSKNDTAASPVGHVTPNGDTGQTGKQRKVSGDTRANAPDMQRHTNAGPATGSSRTRGTAVHTRQPTANVRDGRFLPNSGDVHPAAPFRAAPDYKRNYSRNTAVQRPDFNSLRRNMQAPRHFRNGHYHAPQGYQQRHWGYGERLPRGYFVRDYWISNFLMFGLFAPPSDLIWVRVGNDALLVDRYSGEIVQVRYSVFY